jgi:hypothetical protein
MLIILRLQSSHFAQDLEDTIVILGKIEGLSITQGQSLSIGALNANLP